MYLGYTLLSAVYGNPESVLGICLFYIYVSPVHIRRDVSLVHICSALYMAHIGNAMMKEPGLSIKIVTCTHVHIFASIQFVLTSISCPCIYICS